MRLGIDDRLDLDRDGRDGRGGASATAVALNKVQAGDALGIVHLALELAPRNEGRGRLRILDADPAGSHHLEKGQTKRIGGDGVRMMNQAIIV